MVGTLGLNVEVVWVPSNKNHADQRTKVTKNWLSLAKSLPSEEKVVAAASSLPSSLPILGPVTMERIRKAQLECADVARAVSQLVKGEDITAPQFKKVRSQVLLSEGVLCRNVKLPLEGTVTVPVIPGALQDEAVGIAHCNSAHASWETMYEILCAKCYLPDMAVLCQEHVQHCPPCSRAAVQTRSEDRKQIARVQTSQVDRGKRSLSIRWISLSTEVGSFIVCW